MVEDSENADPSVEVMKTVFFKVPDPLYTKFQHEMIERYGSIQRGALTRAGTEMMELWIRTKPHKDK